MLHLIYLRLFNLSGLGEVHPGGTMRHMENSEYSPSAGEQSSWAGGTSEGNWKEVNCTPLPHHAPSSCTLAPILGLAWQNDEFDQFQPVNGIAMSMVIKATSARQACVQGFCLRKRFLGETLLILITFCVLSPRQPGSLPRLFSQLAWQRWPRRIHEGWEST